MQGASDPIIDLAYRRHAQEIRDSWQCRLLARALRLEGPGIARPVDVLGAAVLSVLAHSFDEAMPVLLRIAFPGFWGIGVPFLRKAARITKSGRIMVEMIDKYGCEARKIIFRNTQEMEASFRRLADAARLDDKDRVEFFAAVQRWVVCDYRLDPHMNPADPDARRLTVH